MGKFEEDAWIIDQQSVAQQTHRLRLKAPKMAREARAGQFFMLQIREGLDPLLRRPFSFHRIIPDEGIIEVLYRVVGKGTWQLSQCRPETRLNLVGPLGNGFHRPLEPVHTPVLIAGGIGIAPLVELMAQLASRCISRGDQGGHLFYGARTAAEMLPPEMLEGFGFTAHWSTDDGSLGYGGYVTRLFQETIEQERLTPGMLYACGPLAMQYHVAGWALEHRVPTQLSLESLMACGIGACLGCALPAPHPEVPTADYYVHVCKDGPIFDAGSIRWHKLQMQQMLSPTFLFS